MPRSPPSGVAVCAVRPFWLTPAPLAPLPSVRTTPAPPDSALVCRRVRAKAAGRLRPVDASGNRGAASASLLLPLPPHTGPYTEQQPLPHPAPAPPLRFPPLPRPIPSNDT